jgi:hypothetical protein
LRFFKFDASSQITWVVITQFWVPQNCCYIYSKIKKIKKSKPRNIFGSQIKELQHVKTLEEQLGVLVDIMG